ncbi:MAG TPA: EamA family transporter [Candidatus Obscuribacterales bacterium]
MQCEEPVSHSPAGGQDKNHSPPRTAWVVLAYAVCALTWGTTWFAIRLSVSPDGFPPFMSVALRFTIASLVIAALWLGGMITVSRPSTGQTGWLGLAGILSAVGFGLVYTAEKWISGGLAAILNATTPVMMALVALATREERVSRRSLAGSVLALAGIFLIFRDRAGASADQAVGMGLFLVSVLLTAITNVILKRNTKEQHPLASTGAFSFGCAVAFWLLSVTVEHRPVPSPLPLVPALAVAYLGIFGSVVALGAYFYLIKHVRLMTLTTLVFFPPVIALFVDALWEKTVVLGPESYLGIAVTLAGVAVSVLPSRQG